MIATAQKTKQPDIFSPPLEQKNTEPLVVEAEEVETAEDLEEAEELGEAEDLEEAEELDETNDVEELGEAEDLEEAEEIDDDTEADDDESFPPLAKNKVIIKNYISETRWLVNALKTTPELSREILRVLSITKDNSLILGFTPVYKLYKGLEDLYKSIIDKEIDLPDNVRILIAAAAEKISVCCTFIEKQKLSKLREIDIHSYLLYLDKAVVGEIFDVMQLVSSKSLPSAPSRTSDSDEEDSEAPIEIQSAKIATLINQHEEMIARTYIIMNQVELLKHSLLSGNIREAKESYNQLASDSQNLQNSLRTSHDQLMSFMKGSLFLENHQEFHGFFVFSNGRKYLIPSDFVVDVISESPMNYERKQNQNFIIYTRENESGTEETREEIPIYALSSLLPGISQKTYSVLETIIIVDCLSQRIGIIVDSMQKFVSLIKLSMPPAFKQFPMLRGLVFDEKYDMIPILSIPGLMKRLCAFRGYDVKKFETATKKRIKHVLVVEDSDTTRLIERSVLESNGFSVEESFDGIDAIEKIKEIYFDLILCDDDMPRMNGELFLDNVRRMEKTKNTPVIAVSEKPIEKANAFMCKSDFDRDILIKKIKELLHE